MDSTDKIYSLEGEAAVIGSMILDSENATPKAMQIISADDFCEAKHRKLFDVICNLYTEVENIDIVILRNKLTQLGILDSIGGVDYLVSLSESVPTSTSVEYYAGIVKDMSLSRQLINECHGINEIARESIGTAEERTLKVMDRISKLSQICSPPNTYKVEDVAKEVEARIDIEPSGFGIGFPSLERMVGNLESGDLIIVGANPSMGKTAFALSCLRNICKNGHKVAIYSLEMTRLQLVDRLTCMEARVDLLSYRTRSLLDHQKENLWSAIERIKQWPLQIIEQPGVTVEQVYSHAMSLKKIWPLDLLIVDYLQIMGGSASDNREAHLSHITGTLKKMAMKMECPIMLLSQLNRSNVQSENSRPRLNNLRGSGAIEQDGDIALLLHREDYFKKMLPEFVPTGEAEIIIGKQRQGPTGVVKMKFIEEYALFEDMDYE